MLEHDGAFGLRHRLDDDVCVAVATSAGAVHTHAQRLGDCLTSGDTQVQRVGRALPGDRTGQIFRLEHLAAHSSVNAGRLDLDACRCNDFVLDREVVADLGLFVDKQRRDTRNRRVLPVDLIAQRRAEIGGVIGVRALRARLHGNKCLRAV